MSDTRLSSWLDRLDPVLGVVRLCRGCGEEWPKDGEFWFLKADGKVLGRCKACWSERPYLDGKKGPMPPMVVA